MPIQRRAFSLALVVAALEPQVPTFAPCQRPRVLDNPIRSAIRGRIIADEKHCVIDAGVAASAHDATRVCTRAASGGAVEDEEEEKQAMGEGMRQQTDMS